MNKLLTELRRRNIFRVAGVYAVVGWILMQVAGALENSLNLPDWFDSAITATLLIGFPIALLLAWAFEMTPEGMKRAADVGEGESVAAKTGHTLDVVIVIGLVLVGVLVVWQGTRPTLSPFEAAKNAAPQDEGAGLVKNKPHPEALGDSQASKDASPNPEAASIAVLPFTDLSPNKDQEYFSDGMAEEILNVLVRVQGLSVASRTSSFQFKGRDIGIPEIAQALKVRHVLEGSVRKAGDTLRITAQLIDTSNDRHLWSQTYDRPLTAENIFIIQDEIAQAIVDALGQNIAVFAKAEVVVNVPTDNLTAYELFLEARVLFQARKDLDVADQKLARALEQDANFAKAWELRAAIQTVIAEYGYSDLPLAELGRLGIEFAEKALTIEPNSATAIAAIANIHALATENLSESYNYKEIIEDFQRALAINPRNGSALNWLGLTYGLVGNTDAALATFQRCIKYEPFYTPCIENEYESLVTLGRMDEALERYQGALDKGVTTGQFVNFSLLAHFDNKTAFLQASNRPLWLRGWHRHKEIYDAYKNLEGDHSALVADIQRFITEEKRTKNGAYLQNLLIPIGAYNMPPSTNLMWGDDFSRYRQSPQFKKYVREVGAYDYWLEVGFPPQCKPVGKNDFACD